jgi:hypothetical protein
LGGNWIKTKRKNGHALVQVQSAMRSEINEKQKKCEVVAHFVKQMPVTAMLVDESRLTRFPFIFKFFFYFRGKVSSVHRVKKKLP